MHFQIVSIYVSSSNLACTNPYLLKLRWTVRGRVRSWDEREKMEGDQECHYPYKRMKIGFLSSHSKQISSDGLNTQNWGLHKYLHQDRWEVCILTVPVTVFRTLGIVPLIHTACMNCQIIKCILCITEIMYWSLIIGVLRCILSKHVNRFLISLPFSKVLI